MSSTSSKKSIISLMIVFIATLLTFGLSLNRVITVTVYVDELFEILQFVSPPLSSFFENYWANGQLPHVLLTKLFSAIHWDVFNLRFGSVLAGTLCIPLMYLLTQTLFGQRIATLSALLLSVTITHLRFTAYARGYSLMLALSLLTIYCFSRAVKTGQRRWWIYFVVVLAINIHNHIFSVFLAAALAVFIILWLWSIRHHLWSRHKDQLKNMGVAGGLLILLLLPLPALILSSQNTADSLSVLLADQTWPTSFPPFSFETPANILSPLIQMSYTFSPTRYPGWTTLGFIIFFFTGIVVGVKRPTFRWATILLTLLLFLPPFMMTIATTILGPWFYALRRYFLFVMPSYLILSSLGLIFWVDFLSGILAKQQRLSIRYIKPILLLFLILLIVFPVIPYVTQKDLPAAPYAAARYVHTHAQPGDIVLCVPDEDWRVTARGANCSFIFKLYPELTTQVYFMDVLANYETLQEFLAPDNNCHNHYVHMPRPHFQMDCMPAANGNNPRGIWLVLWRSRPITVKAVQTDSPNPLTQAIFDSTEIIYLENRDDLTGTLIDAGKIALKESKTPLRKFENYISLATIYAATNNIEAAMATLDKAAFVSRWPQAIERIAELQMQLSFLRIPLEPEEKIQMIWNDEVVLAGIDQNLTDNQPAPGTSILISFYWELLKEVDTNYQVFLHLLDNESTPHTIFDFQPFEGRRPFSDWPAGQVIRETRIFDLPADFPPGDYTLVIGLYKPDTLERVPIHNYEHDSWTLAEWHID